jgi:ABC-2 type transport system ATP-binding protein
VSAIDIDHVSKHYRTGAGIDDVTLSVEHGEVFGFLGPNGAGKSTTIRLVMDLIRPDAGRIRILGREVRRGGRAVRRRLGYLPGELALYEQLTGGQMLDHLASLREGRGTGRSVGDLAERLHLDLGRPIRELSRGNKQKVGLIQAFMGDPEVIILDEPTSGLDPLMQREIRSLMRESTAEGAAVFLSSHALNEVSEVADRVAIIRAGSLVATEAVEGLRSRAVRRIEVRTTTPIPEDQLAALPGASLVASSGNHATIDITGSMDLIVKVLARFEVLDLVAGEPDLEQIFLSYYEDQRRETADEA